MRTMNEIRKVGMDALIKALGPVDSIRFIQQYDNGYGDYTEERRYLFNDLSVDDIFNEIDKYKEQDIEF